jgi:tetratricopeptide (TPR) repeat protein
MMRTRGTFVLVFLLFISLLPSPSFGEILTVTQTVKQTFGGGQSADDARIYGIAKAKREALEKAGTYIESLTIVKNSQVEKDEILAITAGVLKAEVVSQKNYASDDAFGMEIIVNVIVDTSLLEERVKKQLQDKTHLSQLKDTQKREEKLLQKVAKLEEENRKLSTNKQSTQKLKKEFQKASQGLTAVDWFNKASELWDGGKYTDPKKAIEYLNNSIKLQPDLAMAYYNRGIAYYRPGQYQRAIEDYNEAIRLQPDYASAYVNRGHAYKNLGQYQRAIEDFNNAIRLKPDDADVYINRGFVYDKLGKQQLAIEDYDNTICLKPDFALAYNNRGNAYNNLGQPHRAIEDFNEAIRLQPDLTQAYYNRGDAYNKLGQYQRAIEDFNNAIRLQPDDVSAYFNRGSAYLSQGNKKLGCRDAQKACALGDCELLEWSKGKRYCR